MTNVATHEFADRSLQATALSASVAGHLRDGLRRRGSALLAVSGGTTPAAFFACLAREAMDWSKVCVTLVDERWVGADDARSNARLVQTTLLQHAASVATFVPLYTGAATPELGVAEADARLAALALPFDAVVLGMGDDGHTASFFPGGDHLDAALDLQGSARVLPMRAPDAGEPRITLTLSTLLQTRALYLLIAGADKRVLFDAAMRGAGAAARYPIRAVLTQQRMPVAVYWSP